jgi:DNA-binding MarR family transcriptional regulator
MSKADPATEGSDGHPADDIDEIVHQRHRLGVMVVLAEARRADFSYLKSVLELTDGNLGRHLKVLEQAGLIKIEKVFEEGRPRTWVTLTRAGRRALAQELDSMERLIERVRNT